MKNYAKSILATSALSIIGVNAEVDCIALTQSVTLEVSADKSLVLGIVSKQIEAAPGCACEVVKSAIKSSDADGDAVAAIVEAAITAAPDQIRLISQCAIATAPDAAGKIQAVLAKLDPNSGDSGLGSKSSKEPGEVAGEDYNPLDFPGDSKSVVGPFRGTDGGNGTLRPGPQFGSPPIIDTPVVTNPDPDNSIGS